MTSTIDEMRAGDLIPGTAQVDDSVAQTRLPSLASPSGDRRGHVRPATVLGAVLLVSAALGALFLPTMSHRSREASTQASQTRAQRARTTTRTSQRRVTELVERARRNPSDGRSWRALAAAHVANAYETGDPNSYSAAEGAIQRARALLGDDPDTLVIAAGLALAQHRFESARNLTVPVLDANPDNVAALIARIDADIETGRYDEAGVMIDRLTSLRPGVAALSRASYFDQLHGDLRSAALTMRQAVSATPEGSLGRAAALGYLGDLELESGRVDAAMRAYDLALERNKTLPHAVVGRALVDAARHDYRAAANRLDALIGHVPVPGVIALRAEVARAAGDQPAAVASDGLLDVTVRLFEANGAVLDAELAVILADRGDQPLRAVAAAETAYRERRTIFTADALAWALFRGGRTDAAIPYVRIALATNPQFASIRAHAALIFASAGLHPEAARELELAKRNPALSPTLSSLLAQLRARSRQGHTNAAMRRGTG